MFSHIFHLLMHLNVCKCKAQTTGKIYFSSARSYRILLINIVNFVAEEAASRLTWSHNSKERFSRRGLYRKRKWKYKMTCVPSEESDQPTHPCWCDQTAYLGVRWFFAVCTPFNICNLLFSKVRTDGLSRTHIFQNYRKY